ncbi:MAG: hypothetical protein M3Z41_06510 [Candidatus Eremiobacteraeota bacterium]|nr:hypothetical protein [Candidatus Eremiobacteraeota bacterium]
MITLGVSLAILFLGMFADQHPYDPAIHRWEAALAVALAALALLIVSLRSLTQSRYERFAALAGFGGVVIAIAFLSADLLVGPPQRVLSAPGQIYRPPNSARLAIVFPATRARDLGRGHVVSSVSVVAGAHVLPLLIGQQLREHSYVLRADGWPAAYVRAWSSKHVAQTVTQPNGIAFVSPVLQFGDVDKDGMLIDSFAVPALHRNVRVKYYSGLPARGIDIPFLQLEIDEENGGSLFGGVAVSGRTVKQAGMQLLFDLGTYPVVSIAGAPDRLVSVVGAILVLVGCIGCIASALLAAKPANVQ